MFLELWRHSIRLICDGWKMVKIFCESTIDLCTDLGVESGLPNIPDFQVNSLFPSWSETSIVEDNWDSMMHSAVDGLVSLKWSLGAPGTEHVCHNIEQQTTAKLKDFKDWFKSAQHFGRFFTGRFYCDRIAATCFDKPECETIKQACYSFDKVPYEKRFGSCIDFIDASRPLKEALQMFYDASKFQGIPSEDDEIGEPWCDISLVTVAIVNNCWWAYGQCLAALQSGVEMVRNYTRGCKCHRIWQIKQETNMSTYRLRRAAYDK